MTEKELSPKVASNERAEGSLKNRALRLLPTALSIATMIAVCAVTAIAVITANYSDAWILLCAVLIMDSVRNFLEFTASRGMIGLNPTEKVIMSSAIWVVGISFIWVVARTIVPAEITGDFKIMGIITLAFWTISLINWACNFRAMGKQNG